MKPILRSRVAWHEGMLVSPHHFQQNDLHHEAQLATRIQALSPYAWGVVSVAFDTRALVSGQCRLTSFEGLLPDGLPVVFRDGDELAPPVRGINEHFSTTQQSLEVFLGVLKERPLASNIANDPAQRARFRARNRPVVDTHSGATELEVPFADPIVAILFGNENRDDYVCVALGELVRNGTSGFALHPTYVPPLLRVAGSEFVFDGLKRVVASATARRKALAEERRQRDATTIEYNATDITRFLLLNALDTFIPRLRYYSELGDCSSREAYLELVSLAGALCTLSATEDPSTFPDFHYTELRRTFEPLFARLMGLLSVSLAGRFVVVPLSSRDDGMHFGEIGDDRILRDDSRWFLVLHSDIPEAHVVQNAPRLAKVASWDGIAPLLTSAMRGAAIEHELRPPKEIPVRAGAVYFSIPTADPYSRMIRSERKVAVYLPPPFDPKRVRIELCAILPT